MSLTTPPVLSFYYFFFIFIFSWSGFWKYLFETVRLCRFQVTSHCVATWWVIYLIPNGTCHVPSHKQYLLPSKQNKSFFGDNGSHQFRTYLSFWHKDFLCKIHKNAIYFGFSCNEKNYSKNMLKLKRQEGGRLVSSWNSQFEKIRYKGKW